MICLKDGIIQVSLLASVSGTSYVQKQVLAQRYATYVGGEASTKGRVYANILIGNVELVLNNAPTTQKYKDNRFVASLRQTLL